MTDEGTKPGEVGKPNDAGTPKPAEEGKPKDDDTVSIRKGEYNGMKTQLRELKKTVDEFTAARSAEEAEKLKAAQNWEALEKKKQSEIDAMRAELAASKRSALIERARNVLLGAGMSAGLAVDGALSTMPPDIDADAIPLWVDALRTAHPAEFSKPANPIGAPSAGPTGRPTTDQAAALKAKVAATKGKGPAAMEAVMREVSAYMAANGGKNPLT